METVVEKNVLRPDCYVVEIAGKIRSAYGIFVEALKAGLELKQKFPHSQIKIHETDHGRSER
jgi:predicted SpoU family rRNA methylase